DSNTSPTLIFAGDPSGATNALRWGDNLTVRGTGTNTRVLVDMTYFGSTSGTNGYAAILSPTNSFMTNFTARWFVTTNFADTVGRSLEFDLTNNAIWQKGPDKPLFKINYNPAVGLGGTRISATNVLALTNFSTGLMGVGLDLTRKLAAGVFSNNPLGPDTLNLYDISNSSSPVLVDQYSFPTSPHNGNNNRISQTFFKNDLLFTLDGNNGIMVFRTIADSTPQKVELV